MFISVMETVLPQVEPTAPQVRIVKLTKGVLSRVVVRPPPGPNWEVYFKMVYRETSIIPVGEQEWLPLELHPIEITPNWSEWDGTYAVELWFCSPEARFPHTITVEIELDEHGRISDFFRSFLGMGV